MDNIFNEETFHFLSVNVSEFINGTILQIFIQIDTDMIIQDNTMVSSEDGTVKQDDQEVGLCTNNW